MSFLDGLASFGQGLGSVVNALQPLGNYLSQQQQTNNNYKIAQNPQFASALVGLQQNQMLQQKFGEEQKKQSALQQLGTMFNKPDYNPTTDLPKILGQAAAITGEFGPVASISKGDSPLDNLTKVLSLQLLGQRVEKGNAPAWIPANGAQNPQVPSMPAPSNSGWSQQQSNVPIPALPASALNNLPPAPMADGNMNITTQQPPQRQTSALQSMAPPVVIAPQVQTPPAMPQAQNASQLPPTDPRQVMGWKPGTSGAPMTLPGNPGMGWARFSDGTEGLAPLPGSNQETVNDISKTGDQGLTGLDFINSVDDKYKAIKNKATALIEGREPYPPQGRLSDPNTKAALALAEQADPTYSAATFPTRKAVGTAFASGPESHNVNAINTVIQHLGNYVDNTGKLDNGNFQHLNAIMNASKGAMNDKFNSKLVAVRDDVTAVGSEAAKSYKGTGSISHEEQKNWQEQLSSSLGPESSKSTAQEIGHLLVGKIEALQNQYQSAFPTSQKPVISPLAYASLQKLGVDTSTIIPPAGVTEKTTSPPSAAPSFTDGMTKTIGNKTYVFTNGAWHDPGN